MSRREARLILPLLVGGAVATAAPAADDPVRFVDPFIGTGAHGHTFPGATLPFGMVQLSPDTRLEGWDGVSGYHYTDTVIHGFSHTHLSGTGIGDYADILLMPFTGNPWSSGQGSAQEPDADLLHGGRAVIPLGDEVASYEVNVRPKGFASPFDKATERAEPGYYAVELLDSGVGVELTATERTGLHRYRFPAGRPAHVVVDLAHRDTVIDSRLWITGDREIEGYRRSTSWARDQRVFFVARFSEPFGDAILARGDGPAPGARELSGTDVRGIFSFGATGATVLVKVGISAVDLDGARRNLDAELPGWDFAAVRRAARGRWSEALGRIEVEGGTEEERRIFYTALYHSLLAPNVYSDVDGRYRGMDGQIHQAGGRRHYTVFSLWDTFRATHPLFTLIETERTREFVETFLAMYREGGRLPVWELAANETDTMIGYHSIPVISDAWIKGIRGFDADAALDAMLASAMRDERGLDAYRRQGYIGAEDDSESVSKTLEYAYDDACIARMAAGLGRADTAREFRRRSQAWRHLLDPETGFFRPRLDQHWLTPFDPRRVDNNFTEANAWQYGFFVPHDVEGLMAALGGDAAFVQRLDALFEADPETTGRDQADITGRIGQYAHGNEPSHHVAWLYHFAGRPDRSAARVRRILDELYTAEPGGLSGNDDCGQMSSWYVFGAMGLFPVDPCSGIYALGPPIFERVRLHLDGGRTFTIRAPGASGRPRTVRAAQLDARPLTRSWLRHEEIASGGELVLTLSDEPGASWGTAPADRPASRSEGGRVLPAPFARSDGVIFRGERTVELDCAEPGATIRYTLDPAAPEDRWEVYREPIVVRDSAALRFVAEKDGRRSPVAEAAFHRIPHDWTIRVASVPSPQYTAGGPEALIDGQRGSENWRIGRWQGYQGTDFEATVDLGAVRPVHRAGAGFLQDVRSWIWMPVEVVIAVSADGETFLEVARLAPGVDERAQEILLRDVGADLDGVEARYVRIFARNYGTIPEWHLGRGGEAYIFVDEILVE